MINNKNGNATNIPKLLSIGFVGTYSSLVLTICHINMCTVTMFFLLNIYTVHTKKTNKLY